MLTDLKSLRATARELAESGDYANVFFVEMELRRRGFSEVDKLAEDGMERELITQTCIAAQERREERTAVAATRPSGRTKPAITSESQARAALRPLGFRLSQRNRGYMILDRKHRYVEACLDGGAPRELTLPEVVEWLAANAKRQDVNA